MGFELEFYAGTDILGFWDADWEPFEYQPEWLLFETACMVLPLWCW
jgi:hypothetical protein